MKDQYFGDNRDLVKWSTLLHLADMFGAASILQIAYCRPTSWGRIKVGEDHIEIRPEVLTHFRDIRNAKAICSRAKIRVFDMAFTIDRDAYHAAALQFIAERRSERCIVFLDPDTGLEPGDCRLEHVSEREVAEIWVSLQHGDVLALYQHQTNRSGRPWIEPKRQQLALAIGAKSDRVCIARGADIARDVVLFFCQKR